MAIGEDDRSIRAVDLPGSAVDLLQHPDTDGRTTVPVTAVLALNDSDATGGVSSPYVAGIVAGAADLLGRAAVSAHQVPYSELECTVVQGVNLADAHP
ncbi:hypothetical protein ACFWN5_21665 [Streptomyces sp. NPDC058430]|uniref:hypothetical protein n=1 Tax=Streptomyces sp. NPDC058430 TaxID=3346495 RepID=UPI0036502E74